jgi:hypothetical protein
MRRDDPGSFRVVACITLTLLFVYICLSLLTCIGEAFPQFLLLVP